jgi:hypothetical protein
MQQVLRWTFDYVAVEPVPELRALVETLEHQLQNG